MVKTGQEDQKYSNKVKIRRKDQNYFNMVNSRVIRPKVFLNCKNWLIMSNILYGKKVNNTKDIRIRSNYIEKVKNILRWSKIG